MMHFGIWGGVPNHRVTCMNRHEDVLVTGDTQGRLVVWDQSAAMNTVKCVTVFSISCAIKFISFALYEQQPVIVAVTDAGDIFLCSLEDGSQIVSMKLDKFQVRSGVVLSDHRHLAICGQAASVLLVDLRKLRVLRTLKGQHRDWISCMFAVRHLGASYEHRPPVLVTASQDGVVVFWSLQLDPDLPSSNDALPVISVMVEGSPAHLALAGNLLMFALITDHGELLVYSVAKPALLFRSQGNFTGVGFDPDHRIVAWDSRGNVSVFEAPSSWNGRLKEPSFGPSSEKQLLNKHYERQGGSHSGGSLIQQKGSPGARSQLVRSKTGVIFEKAKKSTKTSAVPNSPPTMQMSPSPKPASPNVAIDVNVSFGTKWDPMQLIIERKALPVNGSNNLSFCLGSCVYTLQKADYCLISQWDVTLDTECLLSSSRAWMNMQEKEAALASNLISASTVVSQDILDMKLQQTEEGEVTSTIISQQIMIRGYSDGSVKAFGIPSGTLKWSESGSHVGRVSCLWLPDDYALPGMRSCFLSAGNDGNIVVWDLDTHKPVHVFHQHTGSITHLFGAPSLKSNDPRWRSTFFSVSLDRSVGLFSLQNYECVQIFLGHSEEITSVRWRNDLDVLIVGSWDGEICVWDLGSGLLEQRLEGVAAALVESTSDNSLQPIRHKFTSGPLSASSVYTSFEEPPIQMIMLNLDSLFTYLNALTSLETLYSDFYYQCCSFFIPWDLVDASLMESLAELNLRPSKLPLCAAFGSALGYTVLSPLASANSGMYTNSPALSASSLLAGMTFAQWLLSRCNDDDKTKCSELLSLFGTTLPEKVAYWKGGGEFVEPSLEVLANSWQSEDENVRVSARALFTSTLKRLPATTLSEKCQTFVSRMQHSAKDSKSRSQAVMVLGILGSWADSPLKPHLAQLVAKELLKLLYQEGDAIIAAELLGSGYVTWSKALGDPTVVVRKLFEMSLHKKQSFLAETCKRTLLMIGTIQPQHFALAMVDLMTKSTSIEERSSSLLLVRTCARHDAASLLPQLPVLVEAIVSCLDPAVPNLRSGCMSAATSLLDLLVKRFPMLDFYHKQPQYLALGTEGTVLIFDMQSAVRWHQLKGHKGPIMAVKFSPSGKSIASYSFADGMVKLWSITSSFFGFGSSPHCTKTLNVGIPARGQPRPTTNHLLDTVRFVWKTDDTLILHRSYAEPIKIAL